MSEGKVYIGDTPLLQVATGVDLTNVSTKKLKILAPNGLKKEVSATVASPAIDGILTYQCVGGVAGDLPVPGVYKVQAYVTFLDGKSFTGETAQFKVCNIWE
jgi:hypothetical protein